MSEQVQNTAVEQTVNTQPQAEATEVASVDIEAIAAKASEKAEQKMQAVFKSMLQQQGLDSETINKMTEEWKANQQTPEQIAAEKEDVIQGLTSENASLKQQISVMDKGIPADKAPRYIALANSYVSDEVDFDAALEQAIKDFPLTGETKVPTISVPTNPAPPKPTDAAYMDSFYANNPFYKK